MSKRGAISELNDRNWDDEEEPEEAGEFQKAPDQVLQQRVFKKAKRRVLGEEGNGGKPLAFTGFSGFGLKPPQSKPAETFSGFNPSGSGSSQPSTFGGSGAVNGTEKLNSKNQTDGKDSSYLSYLKALNESVLSWIKRHVEENPYIILTPVFKDYENYMKNIKSDSCNTAAGARDLKSIENGGFIFKTATASVSTENKAPSFSFAAKTTDSSPSKPSSIPSLSSNTSTFKFGLKTDKEASSAATSTFSFGSTSTFSFAQVKNSQGSQESGPSSQDSENKDDEEYVPPKPEVKEIVEEGSLYSIRCKLFHQKEGKWVDRGVGNLHLKPVAEEKTQLLVRADTNLGNILLNIMLSSSMPVNKQGKNNVMLVCVPNPPVDTKDDSKTPVPMLVKVKTESDADMLVKKLKERQQLL